MLTGSTLTSGVARLLLWAAVSLASCENRVRRELGVNVQFSNVICVACSTFVALWKGNSRDAAVDLLFPSSLAKPDHFRTSIAVVGVDAEGDRAWHACSRRRVDCEGSLAARAAYNVKRGLSRSR